MLIPLSFSGHIFLKKKKKRVPLARVQLPSFINCHTVNTVAWQSLLFVQHFNLIGCMCVIDVDVTLSGCH